MNIKRADGRIERICKHGVGHTISVPKFYENDPLWWVHGCCKERCCKRWKK